MSEPLTPSKELLRSLETGDKPVEAKLEDDPNMPDPSPEILKAAQEILDERNGKVVSTHSTKPEGEVKPKPSTGAVGVTDIDDETKIRFLAHILGGHPFEEVHERLGGRMQLTFTTYSSEVDDMLVEMLMREESQYDELPSTRKGRYFALKLAASLSKIDLGDGPARLRIISADRSAADNLESYRQWYGQLSDPTFRIISDAFRDFKDRLEQLVKRANDRDFWPTPS